MPQPAQPAPAQPVSMTQEQAQQQSQTGNYYNQYSPVTNNNARSEAENRVTQTGSLQNTQINTAASLGVIRYQGGTQLYTNDQFLFTTSVNDWGNVTSTATYVHNFKGNAQKLAEREVEQYYQGSQASFCTGLINNGIEINYDLAPELTYCKKFSKAQPIESKEDLSQLKADLQELLRMNKELQRTNEALQLRIIQMQNAPSVLPKARG